MRWRLFHPARAVSQRRRSKEYAFCRRRRRLCRSSSVPRRRRVGARIERTPTEGKKRVARKMRSACADGVRYRWSAVRTVADATRIDRPRLSMAEEDERESLETEVEQALEEARMVLPGIQALFGFQLIAVFNQRFDQALGDP